MFPFTELDCDLHHDLSFLIIDLCPPLAGGGGGGSLPPVTVALRLQNTARGCVRGGGELRLFGMQTVTPSSGGDIQLLGCLSDVPRLISGHVVKGGIGEDI